MISMTKQQEIKIEEFKLKGATDINIMDSGNGKIWVSLILPGRCYTSKFEIGKMGSVKNKTIS